MMTRMQRRACAFFGLLAFSIASSHAAEFFVSPTGSAHGNGSTEAPWNLSTALQASALVKPGDTIWIRAGTYQGAFTCTLLGSATAPIVVRSYGHERATIDGNLTGRAVTNNPTLL